MCVAVGAVVKPVVGVSDGLSNVMHGISNEVSSATSGQGPGGSEVGGRGIRQIRPCRTFFHSSASKLLCSTLSPCSPSLFLFCFQPVSCGLAGLVVATFHLNFADKSIKKFAV